MNNKFLATALIAAAGFASAPAFAGAYADGEVGYVPQVQATSSNTTRAEVRAELMRAQRNGNFVQGGEVGESVPMAAGSSMVSRDAVRNEAIAAVQNGHQIGGEV